MSSTCTHCHELRPGLTDVKISLVGIRTLCSSCVSRLRAMGYDIREATPRKP